MAIREIRTDEDPVLRKKSRVVDNINDRTLELLDDMLDTMYSANGVGLAAPQIGILRRIVVVDIGDGPIKMINPEIIEKNGQVQDYEGCLSVPGYSGEVVRPEAITCQFIDENKEKNTLKAEGFLARAICHEIDHLDGILYTDKAIKMYKVTDEDE